MNFVSMPNWGAYDRVRVVLGSYKEKSRMEGDEDLACISAATFERNGLVTGQRLLRNNGSSIKQACNRKQLLQQGKFVGQYVDKSLHNGVFHWAGGLWS